MASNKDFNPDRDLVYLQVTYPKKRDLIGPYLITEHGLDAARKRLLNLCKLEIGGMNDILLATIRDKINQSDFNFQALNKSRFITDDQNRELFEVSNLLSSSADVVVYIRKEEKEGRKAALHTVYGCSKDTGDYKKWHECFEPYKKAEDMLVWPCGEEWNGVETHSSDVAARTWLLLTACDKMKNLIRAVPDTKDWPYGYESKRQIMMIWKVVANDAEG